MDFVTDAKFSNIFQNDLSFSVRNQHSHASENWYPKSIWDKDPNNWGNYRNESILIWNSIRNQWIINPYLIFYQFNFNNPSTTSTPSSTPTTNSSGTPLITPTFTVSHTGTPIFLTETPSITPTSVNETPSITPSLSSTSTQTPTMTSTQTPTETPTETSTETPTLTNTNTVTYMMGTPTTTPTITNTVTSTASVTVTSTETPTMTSTQTPTMTSTQTPSPSGTPTETATQTPTPTMTQINRQMIPITTPGIFTAPRNGNITGTISIIYSGNNTSQHMGYMYIYNSIGDIISTITFFSNFTNTVIESETITKNINIQNITQNEFINIVLFTSLGGVGTITYTIDLLYKED